jgi:hypothetical protein
MKILFIVFFLFVIAIDISRAQSGVCSSSLVQATVSNLGSNIATYIPTFFYDVANNQFVISVFNNVQVISQSQCANLIGNSAPTPGITSFSVYLSCSGPENNGNGITGGIQLPITNVSTTAILNVINIPVGATYSNIPIKPHNSQVSLSNRQCSIQLQATLFAILGGGYCQACYNVPIVTISFDTGATGDSEPCSFWALTCYNNFDILWRSTSLWLIVDWCTYFVAGVVAIIVYGLVYVKRVRIIQHKQFEASRQTKYQSTIHESELIKRQELSGISWIPGGKHAVFKPGRVTGPSTPEPTPTPSSTVRASGRYFSQPSYIPPREDLTDESSDDRYEETVELLPPPAEVKKVRKRPAVPPPASPQPVEPVSYLTKPVEPSPPKPPSRKQQSTRSSLLNANIKPVPVSTQAVTKMDFQ